MWIKVIWSPAKWVPPELLILYTLTSVCKFSLQASMHFLWYLQVRKICLNIKSNSNLLDLKICHKTHSKCSCPPQDTLENLALEEIDQSNSVPFIHYDPDTLMIYLAGKVRSCLRHFSFFSFLFLFFFGGGEGGVVVDHGGQMEQILWVLSKSYSSQVISACFHLNRELEI